jgi:hypothetical protein
MRLLLGRPARSSAAGYSPYITADVSSTLLYDFIRHRKLAVTGTGGGGAVTGCAGSAAIAEAPSESEKAWSLLSNEAWSLRRE